MTNPPFAPELIIDRAARYEQARVEFIRLANDLADDSSEKAQKERARYLQQAALAQTMQAGLEEAAAMVGVSIAPFV